MRQYRWTGLFFLTAVIFLAGCSPEQDISEKKRDVVLHQQPQQQRVLHWMEHWDGEHDRERLVREVAKEFSLLHPEIKVDLKSRSEIMGETNKITTAKLIATMIRTGKIDWDVIWLDDHIYYLVADELKDPDWGGKYLVDFQKVPGFEGTQKSFILEDPRYRNLTGGIITGPYLEGYFLVLWYNKELTDKMGITVKQYGMTFDDFLGYVRAVHRYNEKNHTDIAPIYEASNWYTTANYLFQNLFKSEINDFEKIKANVGSAEKMAALLKTLEAFEALGKYKPLPKDLDRLQWFNTRNMVLDDKAVFYINGIWMYNHWKAIDKERGESKIIKMMPAEMPVFRPAGYYVGGFIPTWAVLKDAPNKNDAITLLMFWSRPQVAEKWIRYTKALTGVRGNVSTGREGRDIYEHFQANIIRKYGENGLHDTADAGYVLGEENKMTRDLADGCIKILQGEATAREIYDDIVAKVNDREHLGQSMEGGRK